MPTTITEFDAVSITNTSIQFINDNGTQVAGEKFGCVGSIEGETEMLEIIKKCEGIEAKKKTKPVKMTLTLSAHIPVAIARSYFGLTNTGLKTGIYSYGTLAKGKNFILTADVVDEFEDVTKLIAFSNCINTTGFKISIENAADEVALLEVEFSVLPDSLKNFYYEALVAELADATIATTWHSNFTPALVQVATP